MAFSCIVEGGLVADGRGGRAFRADVGILGDRITAVADLSGCESRLRLSARDRVVAPGFIDVLGHSFFSVLSNNDVFSKTTQGITTERSGENVAPAPLYGHAREWVGARGLSDLAPGVRWDNLASYASLVEDGKTAINLCLPASLGLLRACVAPVDRPGPLSSEAFRNCRRLLEEALEFGCVGSTCVISEYPAAHFTREELLVLCRTVGRYGRVASFHIRDEGFHLIQAVEEVIGIARQTGCRAEILHLKCIGRDGEATIEQAITRLEAARSSGLDISANAYPYQEVSLALQELLPGGAGRPPAETAHLLRSDRDYEQAALRMMRALYGQHWPSIVINASTSGFFQNCSIEEVAKELEISPEECVLVLCRGSDDWIYSLARLVEQQTLDKVFACNWVSVCTDGTGYPAIPPTLGRLPCHPRDYGAFPHFLDSYVNRRRLIGLEEAVRRTSRQSAERFGLTDRGTIAPGYKADLVVFDSLMISSPACATEPNRRSFGIEQVIVNGESVIQDGVLGSARPGRVLRACSA